MMISLLNALATVIELIFTVPVAGRLLKWGWSLGLSLISLVAGFFDGILWLAGVRPEKKLRVGVIVLRDEHGLPLMASSEVPAGIEQAGNTFLNRANVRIIPTWEIEIGTVGQDDAWNADGKWVRINPESGQNSILIVGCNQVAFGEDLGRAGSEFEFLMASLNARGNLRRVIGIGAPLIAFIVADINGFLGCSLGPLSDYVTVKQGHVDCVAHELGHACNLPHSDDAENLMFRRGCTNDELTVWQVILLRASRHVAYI
ncbi:MAG: M10 family metallopeptidase domain-containing protein [Escherichia coli]